MTWFHRIRIFFSDFILLPVFVFCLFNPTLMTYALRMGKGQFDIVWNARPIDEVLADPGTTADTRAKLELILQIRQFAFDSIGLAASENYTTFYDQKNQRLMYVVTAAEPYELKAYLWHFPILGDLPYKGFFDSTRAQEEHASMKALGLDADIGGASGWSTLGWFKDPVLSSMLKRSEGDLAELIIHELTHGTIFVKDSADYNENLAQFVGVEGAKWFLRVTYGDSSAQMKKYLSSLADEKIKTDFMLREAHYLDSMYKAIEAFSMDSKRLQKGVMFYEIGKRARELSMQSDTAFGARLVSRMESSGNTIFLSYMRYEKKRDNFTALYEAGGNNLAHFVATMKAQYGVR